MGSPNGLGNSGGNGGKASVTAIDENATGGATASGSAKGGGGGAGGSPGCSGGNGGSASGKGTAIAGGAGYNATATLNLKGGSGNRGVDGASAGDGAAVTATNDVTGATNGGVLGLTQTVTAGSAGYTFSGMGGTAGAAKSSLTFDDLSNSTLSNVVNASTQAIGGYGSGGEYGNSTETPGAGLATPGLPVKIAKNLAIDVPLLVVAEGRSLEAALGRLEGQRSGKLASPL